MSQEISVILSLQTAKALEKLDAFLGRSASGLKQLAAQAAAAYISIEGLHKIDEAITSAIDLEYAIGRLNAQTGLSIPMINALREAGVKAGVPFEDFSRTLVIFNSKIYEAVTQGGKAAEMFEEMGIKLTNSDGTLRRTDSILSDFIEKFKHLDIVQQDAFSRGLFGRAGFELITVFQNLGDSIRDLQGKGSPITEESVRQATEFKVQMREVHEVVEMIFVQIANNLLPTLQRLAGGLNEVTRDAQTNKEVVEGLTDFIKGLITVLAVVGLAIYQFGRSLGDAVSIWVNAFNVLQDTLGFWETQIKATIKLLWDLAKTSNSVFEAMALASSGHLLEAASIISDKYQTITADVSAVGTAARNTYASAIDSIKKITDDWEKTNANSVLDAISQWSKLGSFIKGMWSSTGAPAGQGAPSGGNASPNFSPGVTNDSVKKSAEWLQISDEIYKQSLKLIEADPFKSQLEKEKELLPLLEQHRTMLSGQLADIDKSLAAAKTEDQRLALTKERVKVQGELNDLETEEAKIRANSTLSGQTSQQWAKMLDATQNFAKDASALLLSPIEGFRQGFSRALDEMLVKGKFNFNTLALGMLQVIRQSFVTMVSDWIVSHIIMKGISLAFHALLNALGWSRVASHAGQEAAKKAISTTAAASQVALLTPVATALSLLWATPATLATIASYGGAAVAAPGLIAIAEGLTLLSSAAPREFGGPVEAGRAYIVGEKKPELFVPSVSGTILPSVPNSSSSGQSAGGGQAVNNNLMIHFPDSPEAANRHARENPEFHHIIVDIVQKKAHLIGARA